MSANNKGPKDWGKIGVIVRLEKTVDNQFFHVWTDLIMQGLRPGDSVLVVKDRVAHIAANEGARAFLQSDCDTAFFIDSDCDIGPGYLETMRSLEDEWQYDILQGFYVRRGWPPEAVWFKESELGDIYQCLVWKDDFTEDTAYVGLHNTLVRREVFETMLANRPADVPEDQYTWFYYPQNANTSEDATFSFAAREQGFRVGSTTKVKAGHISRVTTGWQTYQEQLVTSGIAEHWRRYFELAQLVADFTGETLEYVQARAMQGAANTRQKWDELQPQTPEAVRAFYGEPDNGYLYELLGWNLSPFYKKIVTPLQEVKDQRVLVVGAGLGNEVEVLRQNNQVVVFELPGVLRDFINFRFKGVPNVYVLEDEHICDSAANNFYDLIVAVDVLEHIHPEELEYTLDALLFLLQPQGKFYLHNNFGQQDILPQHFDHAAAFARWCELNYIQPPAGEFGFYERINQRDLIRT